MPLYEYECEKCRHRFERIQKFSDPPVDVCPNCGEHQVKKLLSSPAIQFKGTGWYITDYAKKSTTDAGKTGSTSGGDAGGSDGTKKTTGTDSSSSADKKTSG
jgi:putative FmdB family regulatory protein